MEEGFLVLLIIICIIVGIYVDYWISKQFYEVARFKGYEEKKYLWISFFFNIVGYLLVIALPSKSISVSNNKKNTSDELPEL